MAIVTFHRHSLGATLQFTVWRIASNTEGNFSAKRSAISVRTARAANQQIVIEHAPQR
ncbi:hypothetical protein [Rhizobium favelukesii]|uniref:hypothetical protein n=1 Tax=Rhizobium favelukesii TaxID=348824 RepID=UPI000409A52B|nr:hypothetical protein [Rhizobium favelukesii]